MKLVMNSIIFSNVIHLTQRVIYINDSTPSTVSMNALFNSRDYTVLNNLSKFCDIIMSRCKDSNKGTRMAKKEVQRQ